MILVSDPENKAGYAVEKLGDDKMGLYCYYIEKEMDLLNRYHPNEYPCIFDHPSPIRYHKADTVEEEETVYFRDGDDEELDVAPQDRADWGDIETLSYEIRHRIQRLYDMGLNEAFVRQLVTLPEAKLSPLIITEDFRIFLPEYDNMEIVLHPQSKTLYFFYLRHTEGVLFKHLRDHREELYNLYSLISSREDLDKMNQSIDDLVDSTKNTVNVICSRIKSTFASKFQDRLAYHYYINGLAGKPKHITLDRSLIQDRSNLVMVK